ncbi:hypothetical protein [Reichenbachiella ulvae]|uniref:SpoIIAA-like n=1 Tax=Reichenbachiella ulvae TaxID=2980104 RepID=A0ABT3CZL3_9BACT|nr:hypothetical protein [Reichenbachiella ulvae]MCV9389077.1 hypothetical protein [Reichenbachiella ulvae]
MKKLHEAEDGILEFDEEKSTLIFTWKGEVSEDTVVRIFKQAAKAAMMVDSIHWLIDRRKLEEYDAGARIWIKNDFINKYGEELIEKTDKIAAVISDNAMAQVSSNVLIDLIAEKNPEINFQQFDTPIPASNWLIGQVPKEEPKKKKGFFRRG